MRAIDDETFPSLEKSGAREGPFADDRSETIEMTEMSNFPFQVFESKTQTVPP